MEGLLLSELCRICNIHVAKYTCPRCLSQTCSLPCSRRHKLWASCSGVRDPTVYKPMSQLATPSGIDHDYNFLHSIEHRIERSEKLIVEERELVGKDELALARAGEEDRDRRRRKRGAQTPGEEPIQRSLQKTCTTLLRAPKGMRRNLENETSWSRNQKAINWQVEWIREGDGGRILSKASANFPIGNVYAGILQEQRRRALTDEERRMEVKRKSNETKQRLRKKYKAGSRMDIDSLPPPAQQDPENATWSVVPPGPGPPSSPLSQAIDSSSPEVKPILPPSLNMYLLRPRTPSSHPKVLVPLEPSQSLDTILRQRTVLEFPTIYILTQGPADLPEEFMLEEDFFSATGQSGTRDLGTDKMEGVIASADEDSEDSNTSTSGSSSDDDEDEIMEEGELVPTVWGGS